MVAESGIGSPPRCRTTIALVSPPNPPQHAPGAAPAAHLRLRRTPRPPRGARPALPGSRTRDVRLARGDPLADREDAALRLQGAGRRIPGDDPRPRPGADAQRRLHRRPPEH